MGVAVGKCRRGIQLANKLVMEQGQRLASRLKSLEYRHEKRQTTTMRQTTRTR